MGRGYKAENCFYREANDHTFSQLCPLPEGFRHTIPLHPVQADWMREPYAVLVEGGFTQGKLSDEQLIAVAQDLLRRGYRVFFNGDRRRLPLEGVIDGYQYPLHQYATIVKGCAFMVTPNTLLYHYAVQLEKPCIVLSANELLTLDPKKEDQIILHSTTPISQIPTPRILEAIDDLLRRTFFGAN